MNKKSEILLAAQKLFGQFGLKKVSVEDIASGAAVSKVTFYRYYRNKREAFNDVVSMEADQMYEAIKSSTDLEKTARGKMGAHLVTKLRKNRELVNFRLASHEIGNSHWPHITEVCDAFREKERSLVADVLEFGNSSGELAVKDVEMMSHSLAVLLKSMEFTWDAEKMSITLADFGDLFLEILFEGLGKRGKQR